MWIKRVFNKVKEIFRTDDFTPEMAMLVIQISDKIREINYRHGTGVINKHRKITDPQMAEVKICFPEMVFI
jgi:hypothetical protein